MRVVTCIAPHSSNRWTDRLTVRIFTPVIWDSLSSVIWLVCVL
nr:MAG TPA: hypothetical protein [Caudoviricetes sp.]